jgi:hypothetical protein
LLTFSASAISVTEAQTLRSSSLCQRHALANDRTNTPFGCGLVGGVRSLPSAAMMRFVYSARTVSNSANVVRSSERSVRLRNLAMRRSGFGVRKIR